MLKQKNGGMATSKYLDNVTSFIADLPNDDFVSFCDKFLTKIFPFDSLKSATIGDNGYTIINESIFSVIPNESFIKPTIATLASVPKKSISKLIVIVKSSFADQPKFKSFLKSKFKNLIIEIWGINSIKLKLQNFADDDIQFMLGQDSTYSSYFKIAKNQEVAFEYYQEIADYLMLNFKPPLKPAKIQPDKNEFSEILNKVPLNFSPSQSSVWEIYRNSYQYKNLTEKFIQERYKTDDNFKIGLIIDIHSSFCSIAHAPRHHYPVNDVQVIEEMAKRCLKPEYKEHPTLLNLSRGLIMYFFELCEFGARSIEDQQFYLSPGFFDEDTIE